MRTLTRYMRQVLRNGFRWRTTIYRPRLLVTNNPVNYVQNLSRYYGQNSVPFINQNFLLKIDIKLQKGAPISKKLIERVMVDVQNAEKIRNFDAFILIQSCGKFLIDADHKKSIDLVHEIWDILESLNVKFGVNHYTALLDVYLEKDHDFSPSQFLSNMTKKSVAPNSTIFQRLITASCKKGDIPEVTKLMVEMKNNNLPLSEEHFNQLILGHSEAGDIESAINTLVIMKEKAIFPSINTEVAVMCAFAKKGDFKSLEDIFEKLATNNIKLEEKHYMDILLTLATNGHLKQAENFLAKMPKEINSDIDVSRLIIKLIRIGHADLALRLLKSSTTDPLRIHARTNLIIGSLVSSETKVEDMIYICKEMEKIPKCKYALKNAVYFYLLNGVNPPTTLKIMKAWFEAGGEIHDHFFWPLLILESKASNIDGILNVLKSMIEDFKISPSFRTLRDFTIPYMFGSRKEIIDRLTPLNISEDNIVIAIADRYIIERKLKNAAIMLTCNPIKFPIDDDFLQRFVDSLNSRNDVKSFVVILRLLYNDSEKISKDFIDKVLRKVMAVVPDYQPSVVIKLLQEFAVAGLSISEEVAGEIRGYLGGNVSEEVEEMIIKLESGELTEVPMSKYNPYLLQHSNNEISSSQVFELRNKFNKYITDLDYERAAAVFKQLDALGYVTAPAYALAIGIFCELEDLESAEKYVEQFSEKLPQHNLSIKKSLQYAELLVRNGRFQEAVRFISRQPKADENQALSRTNYKEVESLLKATVTHEDFETTLQLMELLASKKLLKAAIYPLGVIIESFLRRKEHGKALEVFERAVTEFHCSPYKIKLLETLVRSGDQVNLEKCLNFFSKTWGKEDKLLCMALVHLIMGKYQLVRKYFATSGLIMSNFRISFFVDNLDKTENLRALDAFLEITKHLNGNQTHLYKKVLKVYNKHNDWKRALNLWIKMQENDISPDREFLYRLKNLLVAHQQPVPFVFEESDENYMGISRFVG